MHLFEEVPIVAQAAPGPFIQQPFPQLTAADFDGLGNRDRKMNSQDREISFALVWRNAFANPGAVQIDKPQFEWTALHEQIREVKIVLHDTASVHAIHELKHHARIEVRHLRRFDTIKPLSNEDAFLHATPASPFTEGNMADDGDVSGFELLREVPLLTGLRGFEKILQRPKGDGMVQVAFDVENLSTDFVTGNAFDGRFLDDLAPGLEERFEQWRKIRLEFPAHAVVLSLNHRVTLGSSLPTVNPPEHKHGAEPSAPCCLNHLLGVARSWGSFYCNGGASTLTRKNRVSGRSFRSNSNTFKGGVALMPSFNRPKSLNRFAPSML